MHGKLDGNKNPRKGKMCLSCGQEGQFSQDKECPVCGQTCRKCSETCHFKVKCPQLCGTHSGSRAPISRHDRRSASGQGQDGCGCGGRERELVTRRPNSGKEDKGDFAAPGCLQRLDCGSLVEHLNDRKEQRSALVMLVIGGVGIP